MKTTIQLWQEFTNLQTVTTADELIAAFSTATQQERDRFCGVLMTNLGKFSDGKTAQKLMALRNELLGVVIR